MNEKRLRALIEPLDDVIEAEKLISAILKLVEEERKELSSGSDACSDWCKSEVKRKELESQLAELKQVSEEMAEALNKISNYRPIRKDGLLCPNMNPEEIAKSALSNYKKLRSK